MERGRSGGVRLGTAVGAVVAGTLLATASVTHAADLSIPIDTAYGSGVAAGQRVELASVAATDLAGRRCDVSVARRDSATEVNAGNDVIVRSGGRSTTLADVEREAGAETAGGTLVLGERIRVVLRMGPDEQFAADLDVRLDCAPPVVASTSVAAAATTDEPPTASSAPSRVGRGGGDLPATGTATVPVALMAVGLVSLGTGALLLARAPAHAVASGRADRRTPTTRSAGWARRGPR